MKTKFIQACAFTASALLATSTQAAEVVDINSIYAGGGLSINSMSNFDSALGFQFFAGLPLAIKLGPVKSAVEVGYMNSGDMEWSGNCYGFGCSANASGLWANYVATMAIAGKLHGIGRVGLDFGDDDGFMFGIGAGYDVTSQLAVRAEYVARDNVNSLQANVIYRLK